jgi:Mg/Co/Ni transporter MgtE
MNTDTIIIENFLQKHGTEVARALEKFEPEELAPYFSESSVALALEVLPHMNPHLMSLVFELMPQEKVTKILESMDIQQALLSIRMMKNELATEILNSLSPEKSGTLKRLLKYLEFSVGSHIDTSVLTLSERMTVKEAMEQAKRHKRKIHPNLFVLTSDRNLAGVISVSDLITENSQNEISSIMNTRIITLSPDTPIHSIVNHKEWKDFYALPVVDNTSLFLGVIKLETIRAILAPNEIRREGLGDDAISALGELYQIGLAGLLKSASDLGSVSKEQKK